MKKLLLFSGIIALLTSCGSDMVDLAIDNPTDFPVYLKVDTLEVEVPPKEVVWVEMGPGEHTITLSNDSIIKYTFYSGMYMINPTLSQYLLTETVYGSSIYANMSSLPNKLVDFYGIELEGPYEVYSDVIVAANWDYGPREALPEMIEMDEGENYAIMKKLVDINDLIEMMGSYDGEYDDEYSDELTDEEYEALYGEEESELVLE